MDLTTLKLPTGDILTDERSLTAYAQNTYTQELLMVTLPMAIIIARSVADVQATMRFATAHQIGVIPQGAQTSIVNSSAGLAGAVILNVAQMNHILKIDTANQTAVVEPGVINGHLDAAARQQGFFYAPDPGSKELSSIGGNIATNAGGMASLKYGTTKQNVLGLQVVLANGELLTLGGETFKNNVAYNLLDLFIGSEGTLGIIVEATVRLLPIPYGDSVTGLATFPSMTTLSQAVQTLQASGLYPAMLEVMNQVTIAALDEYEGSQLGAEGAQAMLIFQLDVAAEGALAVAQTLLKQAGATHLSVTTDATEAARIMKYRQDIFAAGAQYGRLIVEDIAVPLGQLATAVPAIEALAQKHHQKLLLLGHAGDGNLHPDVILAETTADLPAQTQAFIDDLLTYAISIGGTISAEHGVGELKQKWARQQVPATVQALQQQIKAVFDPQGILNLGRK